MDEQLKLPEVARRLQVSEKTARRYVKSGALPSTFVGGAYRVSEEDLLVFLRGARVTPGGDSPKGSAPPSPEPSFNDLLEEERRERGMYAAALMENLSERAEALEETYRSSVDAIPVLEHRAFNEAHDALTLLYEEMAARGTPPTKMQDAKERLDEAASRLGGWYWRQAHPESHEAYQTRRALALKRVNREQKLERNDNAARRSERERERPEAG